MQQHHDGTANDEYLLETSFEFVNHKNYTRTGREPIFP